MKTIEERIDFYSYLAGSKAKTAKGKIQAALKYARNDKDAINRSLKTCLAIPRKERLTEYDRQERRAQADPSFRRKFAAIKAAKTRAANKAANNEDVALLVAECVEAHIRLITKSDKGTTEYGHGREIVDWTYYSRSYGKPAKWRNGGVTRDVKTGLVSCHPVGGNTFCIETSPTLKAAQLAPVDALLDGDAYGVTQADGTVTRHDSAGKAHGVAIHWCGGWEHGADFEQCRQEIEHKRNVAQTEVNAKRKEPAERLKHAKALILRLCPNLPATTSDARKLGFCQEGIRAFQRRYKIGETSTIGRIQATGNPLALELADTLAHRVATKILTHK